MVNVNGKSGINGDKWIIEKIMFNPHTVTVCASFPLPLPTPPLPHVHPPFPALHFPTPAAISSCPPLPCWFATATPSHAQMDQAHSSHPHLADRGHQFMWDPHWRSLWSVSPHHNFVKGPCPVHHRSWSKGVSPWRSGSFDAKRHRPFHANKPPPVCPKCLRRHDDCPDCLPCNLSSLWDNSSPSHCSCDQQGHLLNKSGRALCWDFQHPRGCSGQGHNHECSGCGDPTHGAQECPHCQHTAGSPMK